MTIAMRTEYTDTFAGEANYAWLQTRDFFMPELTHYGYDGGTGGYARANHTFQREAMRKAKALHSLTGVRGVTTHFGDTMEFRPYGMATILFVESLAE